MLGSKDTDGTFEKSRYDRHDIFNFRFSYVLDFSCLSQGFLE